MHPFHDGKGLASARNPVLRKLVQFGKGGARGSGAPVDDALAAACWYWSGESYKAVDLWPLENDEAKLVETATVEHFRGRGMAPKLIAFSTSRIKELGNRRLFARVWRSNQASQSASRKAGWSYVAFVVQVPSCGLDRPLRFLRTT
jgi:ribosomal protein S18 acetylase RimI-like enzyme